MWIGNDRLEKTLDIIQQNMDRTVARRKLIASNVANAETPNYKAVDLDFQRLVDGAQRVPTVELARTNTRHLLPKHPAPELPLSWTPASEGEGRADGNTVELENEMAKMTANHLRFQALTEALNRVFGLLKNAINEGGGR
jgi:flagellar basal-body rod protein FlgB